MGFGPENFGRISMKIPATDLKNLAVPKKIKWKESLGAEAEIEPLLKRMEPRKMMPEKMKKSPGL